MSTQMIERQNIHNRIDDLPDFALPMVDEFLDFVRFKVRREEEHIPNAETIAAMEELQSGGGKRFLSIEALMRDLHDENDD